MTAVTTSGRTQLKPTMGSTLSYADDSLVRHTITPDPYVSMTLGPDKGSLGPRSVSCTVDPASAGMVTFSRYLLRLHGSRSPSTDVTTIASTGVKGLQSKPALTFNLDGLAAPAHGGRWVLDSANCGNHNSDPRYADHYRPDK